MPPNQLDYPCLEKTMLIDCADISHLPPSVTGLHYFIIKIPNKWTIVNRITMAWKSIIFTFCLIKSWSHDQGECTNIFHN